MFTVRVHRGFFSFVRKNMRLKLDNVSNKWNYGKRGEIEDFLQKYDRWTIDQGLLHPHPFIGTHCKLR